MKNRFVAVFEETLAANRGGEVRNLLITDDNAEFLEDALRVLRSWTFRKTIHLVEIDETDGSWLSEIQSREFFEKLNQPNTILLIKNYATVSWLSNGDNTPRNFLRDAVVNRHYGCGNDFVPSDELPNLLFVIAINDLSPMHWREDEYSLFTIMHEDDAQGLRENTHYSHPATKMHPVMSAVNKVIYWVSDDEHTLRWDVGDAFGGHRLCRPIRNYSVEERTEMIHDYLENNLPPFCDHVDSLILKMGRFDEKEHFVLDDERLRKYFPDLKIINCTDVFNLMHGEENIYMLNPFDLGELAFNLAREGDFEMANHFTGELWALDHKWAKFFREVAADYQLSRDEYVKCYPDSDVTNTGLDKLFRIYLLGWYSTNGNLDYDHIVYAEKYRDIEKAVELLETRFNNRSLQEVIKTLYCDLSYVKYKEADSKEHERDLEYAGFMRVLTATDRLYPGTIDKMYEDGTISRLLS